MEERLSMKQAAERLDVFVDIVRRRTKNGEFVGEKEPTPQGYEWRIILPREESDATEPQGDPVMPSPNFVSAIAVPLTGISMKVVRCG